MRITRCLLPLAVAALLAAGPAAAQSKIAVISTPVLLRDAPQIKAADAKLKAEFQKREQDLQAERRKFQEDFKKAQREADAMSPQQKAATEKDLFSRRSDLDLKERQFSEQAQARNQEDFKKAQREADAMSPQQKAATEKDLFSRRSDLDLKERQFSEQAQSRNAELQRDVLEKINQAIDQVATEKGLELVVRDPAFAAPSLDITGDVLKKLAAMPQTAAPAAPADAKKKK